MEVCKLVLVIASVERWREVGRWPQDHHDDRCDDYLMIIMIIRRVGDSSTGDF